MGEDCAEFFGVSLKIVGVGVEEGCFMSKQSPFNGWSEAFGFLVVVDDICHVHTAAAVFAPTVEAGVGGRHDFVTASAFRHTAPGEQRVKLTRLSQQTRSGRLRA